MRYGLAAAMPAPPPPRPASATPGFIVIARSVNGCSNANWIQPGLSVVTTRSLLAGSAALARSAIGSVAVTAALRVALVSPQPVGIGNASTATSR